MTQTFLTFATRLAISMCLCGFSQSLLAQQKAQRIALVIGNDAYIKIPALVNARSDARAVAASLQKSGFEVILRTDLNDRGMREAVRMFKARLTGGTEAVFYFSGHGVQVGAGNYLLPIDIAPDSEEQVKDDGLALQKVLDDMAEQKTRFAVAIIDACRDNPFPKVGGRNIGSGKGLAASSPATGQMVLYAAGTGQTALDRLGPTDRTPNGVFTRVLLREMDRPGLPVDRILKNVRQEVVRLAQSVGREQVPALYDQSVGEFYFRGSASTVTEQKLDAAPVASTEAQKEDKFWDDAKAAGNKEGFEAYLESYPRGRYVSLAKANIARLLVGGPQAVPTENERNSFGMSSLKQRTRIKVITDQFFAEIDPLGGELSYLELLTHRDPSNKTRNLAALGPEHRYTAQSGLIGEGLPNHTSVFSAAKSEYQLEEGKDILEVRLDAAPLPGSVALVSKVLVFQRGSHVIRQRLELRNTSNRALITHAYYQLTRDGGPGIGDTSGMSASTVAAVYNDKQKLIKVTFRDIEKNQTLYAKSTMNGWIGLVQNYYVAAILPPKNSMREFYTRKLAEHFYVAGVILPIAAIAPGTSATINADLYAGPQTRDVLRKLAPGLDLLVDNQQR